MNKSEMNRYIIRTSLFWILLFAAIIASYVYWTRSATHTNVTSTGIQPIASGPMEEGEKGHSTPTLKMDAPLVPVQLTNDQMSSIGVKTGLVEYKQLSDSIRATGTVNVDERLQSSVQIRFSGFIRKVFANSTYQFVKKGDPLFTIYSPELAATQEEYLVARRNRSAMATSNIDGVPAGASSLATAAEQRLRQWDIPADEISHLEESGKAIAEMSINSPASGYIMERNVLPNMYIEPATKLYTLADLSRVWVNAQVFQNDVGRLKRGNSSAITVDAYPGRVFPGHIEEILPEVDLTTRTVKVRLEVSNPRVTLKPGMFVNVELKSALGRQLVVPASAVFQTGTRQLVFIDHGSGNLEPKDVSLGARIGDDFIVLRGVKAHQQIVTSANFLLDSESQLQAAAGANTAPPAITGSPTSAKPEAARPSIDFSTEPNPAHKGSNALRVRLTRPDGEPLAGAEVTVTFSMAAMPAMGMGAVNVSSLLVQKSGGVYEGTSVLPSGGTWQVTVTAKQNGTVIGTKQLRANAEGGM